jgi:hypothetical protein
MQGKFELDKMRPSPIVLVIGKRYTGKTTLVREMLVQKPNWNCIVVAPPSTEECDATHLYDDIVPSSCIFKEYDPRVVEAVVKNKDHINGINTVVLDDCLVLSDKFVQSMFYNERQYRVALIVTQSRPTLPPSLRANVDYVFILGDESLTNRQRIYSLYAERIIPTFDVFCKVMDEYTRDHGCLVIDCASNNVFWYTPPA